MRKIFGLMVTMLMIMSNCFAALNENNVKKSQVQVMHDFMQTLDKSTEKAWINALDEATNVASAGKFPTINNAVQSFWNDYVKTIKIDAKGNITDDSAKKFLLKYCGINLSNEDVGAIIGKDTGESLVDITSESLISENVDNIIYLDKLWNDSPVSLSEINKIADVFAFRTPLATLSFNKYGLDVVVSNYEILDKKDKIIVNGLYNWWVEGALDLIEKSYGITFTEDELHQLIYLNSFKGVSFLCKILQPDNTLAASGKLGSSLVLWINKKYFDDNFDLNLNPSGKLKKQILDRTIAHEMTHAIMAAKIKTYEDFPLFVKEGLAELTIGADDTRNLINLLKNSERLSYSFYQEDKTINDDVYCAGYMFFRYFAKQSAESKTTEKNQPMTFSHPVEIGKVTLPPMGYIEIDKADYHKGTPCTVPVYQNLNLYEKGEARFGNGEDALYFYYDVNKKFPHEKDPKYKVFFSRFGAKDVKNTVHVGVSIPTIIWLLKTNTEMTFYILEHGDASGLVGTTRTIIGRKKDGTFVKYFDTYEIKKQHLGKPKTHKETKYEQTNKIFFKEDKIIIPYYIYTNIGEIYQFIPIGEFRFKWDDDAQWFSVEHVVY